MELQTQTVTASPRNGDNELIAAGFPDDIRELGDRIAALTKAQVNELVRYLEQQ